MPRHSIHRYPPPDSESEVSFTNPTTRINRRTQSSEQHDSFGEIEICPQGHKELTSSSVGLRSTDVLGDFIPPISVLIVEDNSIDLRIFQTMMQRLAIRAQTAVNGKIAVEKWKTGGFHLVLMDLHSDLYRLLPHTTQMYSLIGSESHVSAWQHRAASSDLLTSWKPHSTAIHQEKD
jgi:PleD family two-component response regulator